MPAVTSVGSAIDVPTGFEVRPVNLPEECFTMASATMALAQ
jgi:hypothetical protein